jgi:hypothetical protein
LRRGRWRVTLPELQALEGQLKELRHHPTIAKVVSADGQVVLQQLKTEDVAPLLADEAGSLFLMAAADLNRTALRTGILSPDAQLVAPPLRRAFVVRSKLPFQVDFDVVVRLALQRREPTLSRGVNAATETLFRERLEFEGIPIRMKGAYTRGLLIDRRKPDGVYPDPETGRRPQLYLEVKKINRVADDMQKRLYEIAEVSLELKLLYGDVKLQGLDSETLLAPDARADAAKSVRSQIISSNPTVVALILCRTEELERARRYREGAEAFIDRVFFSDEIDDCIAFLAERTNADASAR